MTLHFNTHHGDDTQHKINIVFSISARFHQILGNVRCILDMFSKENTSSFVLSSAVSGGRHLPALHTKTGESGVLVGGNCQPNADLLDMVDLFQGTAQSHRMSSVQLTEMVVRVQLLHHEMPSYLSPRIPVIPP